MDCNGLLQRKSQWRLEQTELKKQLITTDATTWSLGSCDKPLTLVGGVDISFYPTCPSQQAAATSSCCSAESAAPPQAMDQESPEHAVAALVVLTYPDLKLVYEDFEPLDMEVPYCAGFLAFREVPAYQRLLQRAAATPFSPQVVMVDGCGTLHYEGFGAACHLGVACGIPAIGVAKNLLMVEGLERSAVLQALEVELDPAPGSPSGGSQGSSPCNGSPAPQEPAASSSQEAAHGPAHLPPSCGQEAIHSQAPFLIDRGPAGRCVSLVGSSGKVLGAALRPAGAKRPIFLSVGHRVSLETSIELVWSCCRHRVPEPTRQADIKSRQYVREHPVR